MQAKAEAKAKAKVESCKAKGLCWLVCPEETYDST